MVSGITFFRTTDISGLYIKLRVRYAPLKDVMQPREGDPHNAREIPCNTEESETRIKIKFALVRGGGAGGQGGKSSKTLFFMGNVMTIKLLQILLSRNFVVVAQAPRGT